MPAAPSAAAAVAEAGEMRAGEERGLCGLGGGWAADGACAMHAWPSMGIMHTALRAQAAAAHATQDAFSMGSAGSELCVGKEQHDKCTVAEGHRRVLHG